MTQSAITFPSPGNLSKTYTVVLNEMGGLCCVQYSILRKVPSMNTGLKIW